MTWGTEEIWLKSSGVVKEYPHPGGMPEELSATYWHQIIKLNNKPPLYFSFSFNGILWTKGIAALLSGGNYFSFPDGNVRKIKIMVMIKK